MRIAQVSIKRPVKDSIFNYLIPDQDDYQVGDLVKVPFGRQELQGCVVKIGDQEELFSKFKLKPIIGKLNYQNSLNESLFQLVKWTSKYYQYPFGPLLFEILPKELKVPRKVIECLGKNEQPAFELSENHKRVVSKITQESGFNKFLIHGVTGCGKSGIYLDVIKKAIGNNEKVLFLLPEINLTPQFLDFFTSYLDCEILSYHSSITTSKKVYVWNKVAKSDEPLIVIGVRSSVFLPFKDLGLIIVDEEHDNSFKQEEKCCYNGRDVALKKAQIHNCPVVLGSATPSIEMFHHFKNTYNEGKNYFALEKRISDSVLPEIIIENTRPSGEGLNSYYPFTKLGVSKIKEALTRGEQILIFLNKLGQADFIKCGHCGYNFECPNCSVKPRYFKRKKKLICRLCQYSLALPNSCEQCGHDNLIHKGIGTEALQGKLQEILPTVGIDRFDREEISNFKQLENKLDQFHSKKIDILIGTQMLSKGHNFKNVNLVLIFGMDSQLHSPDFRSSEKTFQLLSQVSGRSGRFGKKGEVILHTMDPGQPLFNQIQNSVKTSFYSGELAIRKLSFCPPFSGLVMITLSSKKDQLAQNEIMRAKATLDKMNLYFKLNLVISSPSKNNIEKILNSYSWNILIRGQNRVDLHRLIYTFKSQFNQNSQVKLKIDVDPIQFN